jgi:amino acid transporter, AAT family
MLAALGLGLFLPQQVYVFLVSSGGFALLFTYVVIIATHFKFRKKNGCPGEGKCQLPGYPFSSWLVLISLIAILASMPLVPGQGAGLAAGLSLVALYTIIYRLVKIRTKSARQEIQKGRHRFYMETLQPNLGMEISEEFTPDKTKEDE